MTTSTRVEDARLREILAAAEYLNGEPWGFLEDDERVEILIVRAPNDAVVAKSDDYKRASFIADCDPKVIRSILSELLELRAAAQEAAFLASRLNELEWSDLDDTYRDFHGHVAPSLERLLMHVRSLSQGAGHEQ